MPYPAACSAYTGKAPLEYVQMKQRMAESTDVVIHYPLSDREARVVNSVCVSTRVYVARCANACYVRLI